MDAVDSLSAFRSEYGRLCSLAAQALSHGEFDRDAVSRASRGQGTWQSPELLALMSQRLCVNMTLTTAARAGNDRKAIITAALEAKTAVEGEWDVRIPVAS